MPYSHLNDFPADVRTRAARVRLVGFDVDGTLTDGGIRLDSAGGEGKTFNVHDGLGLTLLRRCGIEVALITGRDSAVVSARARELGLVHVHQGVRDKRACLDALRERLGLSLDAIAFMGDDLPDLPVLTVVGLAVAPANAHPWIRDHVHWRTHARGGDGAARELCDLLLAAGGHAERVLSGYLGTDSAPGAHP